MKQLITCLIIVITIITGCRYKEGPMISFNSVEKRIEGTWQVIGFTSDGVDSLQYYNDSCGSIMQIYKEYHDDTSYNILFKRISGNLTLTGYCTLFEHNKRMDVILYGINVLGPIGNKRRSQWEILTLKKNELKISTDFNGKNYIISFKRTTL